MAGVGRWSLVFNFVTILKTIHKKASRFGIDKYLKRPGSFKSSISFFISIYHTGQRVLDLRHRHKESLVIMWNTQTLAINCKISGIN